MKILSISILLWNGTLHPYILSSSFELSSFSFFQRSSAQEILTFVSREVFGRSKIGDRHSVQHKEYLCHCQITDSKIGVAIVTDSEYPSRVVFSLALKALEEFTKIHGTSTDNWNADMHLSTPALATLLQKYQDPSEADSVLKIQKDLDETKDVLVKSIDNLLIRGEKLDSLADKSDDLSIASKTFLKQSEAMNSCCVLI